MIDLVGPLHWQRDGLRSTVDAVRPGGPGTIIVECDGRRTATVSSTRAIGRVRRAATHGIDADVARARLFGQQIRDGSDVGLHPLRGEVDLAGVLAGWVDPASA